MRLLPLSAVLLSLGGLIPFLGLSLAVSTLAPDTAAGAELALVAYAAVILSFVGAVHWGFALTTTASPAAQRARYGLGVLPALAGWAGLLVAFTGLLTAGLMVQVVSFIAVTIMEGRAAGQGLMPPGSIGLRYVLSAVVIVCLVSVCLVRLFGVRI